MGGRGFESRQKRPKLKDENICILGDASFSHKKSIPDQKGARSSASISRVCPGRVGADPGTHLFVCGRSRRPINPCGRFSWHVLGGTQRRRMDRAGEIASVTTTATAHGVQVKANVTLAACSRPSTAAKWRGCAGSTCAARAS